MNYLNCKIPHPWNKLSYLYKLILGILAVKGLNYFSEIVSLTSFYYSLPSNQCCSSLKQSNSVRNYDLIFWVPMGTKEQTIDVLMLSFISCKLESENMLKFLYQFSTPNTSGRECSRHTARHNSKTME